MKSFLRTYSQAVLSGVVLALCFPTWHWYPAAWIALVPLLTRTWQLPGRSAAVHFFLAGLAFYLVLLQWLMTNVYWAGGWAFWGYVFLAAFMAAYWALVGASWRLVQSVFVWIPPSLSLAVLWAAMEHLQSFAFTGFGWGALAYSQGKDLPLLQWVALGGTPLLSGILVAFNGLVAGAVTESARRFVRLATALLLVFAVHAAGYLQLEIPDYGETPFNVAMVQADFPLEMKWDPEYTLDMVQNTAEKSRLLARVAPVDLIVWPESLIMDDIDAPGIREEVAGLARDTGATLFVGAHRTNRDTSGSMNSSYLVTPEGTPAGHYDKIHLAPFGEYVPLSEYLPFVSKVVPAIGDIESGHTVKTFPVDSRRIGPLICFEVLFSNMARALRQDGADLLVVITNLGWFGASNAIPQELEIARTRAVETRLPLAHCANTGITGMFDPWGRFTLIDTFFDGKGNAYKLTSVAPAATRMYRFGGVLPAALPAKRSVGPHVVPMVLLAGALVLIASAAFWRRWGSTRTR